MSDVAETPNTETSTEEWHKNLFISYVLMCFSPFQGLSQHDRIRIRFLFRLYFKKMITALQLHTITCHEFPSILQAVSMAVEAYDFPESLNDCIENRQSGTIWGILKPF